MGNQEINIDPIWEEKYASGHTQNYPWDSVVSFVFRNAPRDRLRSDIRVLEVGFGTGPNLWFAAREGFQVAGVEGSVSALEVAKKRFVNDGFEADLRLGDFTQLPFEDGSFDLVIDRCSLCCVGVSAQQKAVNEIHRCLKKGGRFFHNTYSDKHSSFHAGEKGDDGVITAISGGTLVGVGEIAFSSMDDLNKRFLTGWRLVQIQRRMHTDMQSVVEDIHAEWLVVAEKL